MKFKQQAFYEFARLIKHQKKLWLPFCFAAAIEAVLLFVIWLAPFPPFSVLLAPPIRHFSGDYLLHYPWHLWYLYHSMTNTHALTTLLAGAFLSGLAGLMVRQAHQKRAVSLRDAIISRQAKYPTLALVWLASWLATNGIFQAVKLFSLSGIAAFSINVLLAVLMQAVFIYPIFAAVFERLPWWKALWRGILEFFRHPWDTLLLTFPPSVALIGFAVIFNEGRVAKWMMGSGFPEMVFVFLLMRLLMVTAVDAVMTVGAAFLWCRHHEKQS